MCSEVCAEFFSHAITAVDAITVGLSSVDLRAVPAGAFFEGAVCKGRGNSSSGFLLLQLFCSLCVVSTHHARVLVLCPFSFPSFQVLPVSFAFDACVKLFDAGLRFGAVVRVLD